MNTMDLRQGSSQWLQARTGRCTGSRVKDALCFLKNGEPGAPRKRYLTELVAERLTGFAAGHFVSDAMAWGTDHEAMARAAYEIRTGNDVDTIGLCMHPVIKDFASSPDGFIGEDGVIEIKCPQTATHLDWMDAGIVPEEHRLQLLAEMACSGRKWAEFVSFDPRLPMRYQLFIKRLERDDKAIDEMEAGVVRFLADVEDRIAMLNRQNPEIQAQLPDPQAIENGITDADIAAWYRQMQASL